MRSFAHWNIRYIYDRILVICFEKTHPGLPWVTKDSINFLCSWLRPTDVGLEWGSGRSTVWFAQRVSMLTSIDHDPEWHARVTEKLKHCDLKNVECLLLDTKEGGESPYVYAANKIPHNNLDFALIDGRIRDHCALAVIDKLRPGGILIVDNVNRYLPSSSRSPGSRSPEDAPASDTWASFSQIVRLWRCFWTTNGVSDTAIWIKP